MNIFSKSTKVGSYTLCQNIGIGIFGEVFKATSNSGCAAVKRLDKLSLRYNKKRVQNEIKAGKILCHQGVVKMIQSVDKFRHSYIIMEYIDGYSLIEFMEQRNYEPLVETLGKDIFSQLISAVQYCHSKGFAHRDIKLDNLLIDKYGKVKLIDFGLCEPDASRKTCRDSVGSLEYCAPEVLQGKPHNAMKADIWSCGVILFALLFGEFPFSSEERRKQQGGINVPLDLNEEDQFEHGEAVLDLLPRMLCEVEVRLSVDEVGSHKWLTRDTAGSN